MKRGRPSIRHETQTLILQILSNFETPISINTLRELISKEMGRAISWNTVQKYLQELVEMGKVEAITTPHSKIQEKEGLTVYILKK